MPRALITGITGQDAGYLADFLESKGYEVHGAVRPRPNSARQQSPNLSNQISIHPVDLRDAPAVAQLLRRVRPHEVYHLAAQTHIPVSFEDPGATVEANVITTLRLLEGCQRLDSPPRFFHASTSQIFGRPDKAPQDEQTPVRPVNPYGASKAMATDLVRIWRESHGLFAVNGILFNHESPRRGPDFVTGKICRAAAAIKLGRQRELLLGDVHAHRDWGDARDFIEGFWRSLQHSTPDDYVFATGELHSVQQVVDVAFATVGLDPAIHVRIDPSLFRKTEPSHVVGNPAKACAILGWTPLTPFAKLIRDMTEAALLACLETAT
ncbi:MAG: SDR family oxidoreductase [Pedosphaera sp.]|nr:SDR family oxidoreductase [Pedosphaera sp.]